MNARNIFVCAVLAMFGALACDAAETALRDSFSGRFSLGAAVGSGVWMGGLERERSTVERHFASITAENEMKPYALQPAEGVFKWDVADRFVEFGERNGMKVIGHCLVWHNQMPGWFFKGPDGKDVDRETLIKRMRSHIHAVVGRYRGRVHGWDVVNEAFDGEGNLHDSPWLRIIGSDFIELAFRFAREADPQAELYYNDFGMASPGKRRGVARMVRDFRNRGIRIDGVGMQTHVNLDDPDVGEWEKSIEAFAAEGVKVMVTEMDVSVLPSAWNLSAEITNRRGYDAKYNPWKDGRLPDDVAEKLARRYEEFFTVLLRRSDYVDRVTLWGVEDGGSWLNDFPMRGRTDYPLFFGRDGKMKLCAERVAKLRVKKESFPPRGGKKARFRRFSLESEIPVVEGGKNFANPILPGMAPDPSLTRKGGDYYLANSSFSYYPGIPVWHSTDLVNWDFCGYCAARPSQLKLGEGLRLSAGVYAPDIKYNPHNDTFYLIVTVIGDRGNVIYKTKDPHLGWSEPIKVPVGGIDPSMYFEDGKTAWILNNDDAPDGKEEYPGHRTVRMRKYDLLKDEVVPGTERIIINKGVRPEEKPIWCEGPHLYRIDGVYYVMTAEGGTAGWHSEVIWRSDRVEGPYRPCSVNPILTQRDIRDADVTCAGHADLIQTPEGEWMAVFLGVLPYRTDGRDWCPTGRSTFLWPVKWIGSGESRQPIILDKGRRIEKRGTRRLVKRDDFRKKALDPMWFQLRTPKETWCRSAANGRPGLEIEARGEKISGTGNPSCLLRWIKSSVFTASVAVDFSARAEGDFAGLVLYQNETCHYALGKSTIGGRPCVALEAADKGGRRLVASVPLKKDAPVMLKADVKEAVARFCFSTDGKTWTRIGGEEDAKILTTDYAGGFTGAAVGLYATSDATD